MLFTVGASLLAMVVNDNACLLAKRGALESIASKLAPTELFACRSELAVRL
jgi:putative Mg2+ transporter-C (MgtC) family protein